MNNPVTDHKHCDKCGKVMKNMLYDICSICKMHMRLKGEI